MKKQEVDYDTHFTLCLKWIWESKWWNNCILNQYLPKNIKFDKIDSIDEEENPDEDFLNTMLNCFYQEGQFKDNHIPVSIMKERILKYAQR